MESQEERKVDGSSGEHQAEENNNEQD